MATVASIIDLLKDKLLPYERAYAARGASDAALIRAIDSGKEHVWQTVVAASHKSNGNWFSKQAAVSATTANNAALPADFHALLSLESAAVKMRPTAWAKQVWRDDRKEAGSVDPATLEVLYYVVGGDTSGDAQLQLSRAVTTLAATLQYTYRLSAWTASGDNIDAMPAPFRDAVATWAAAVLMGAAQDVAISQLFHVKWKDSQELVAAVSEGRQFAGVVTAEDSDSDG